MKIENQANWCNCIHLTYFEILEVKIVELLWLTFHITTGLLNFRFCILTWFNYFFRALTTSISMVHLPKDPVTQHCFFHLALLTMQTSKKDFCGSKKTKSSPVGRKGSLFLPRTTFIASKKEILVLPKWEASYSRLDFKIVIYWKFSIRLSFTILIYLVLK